MLCLNKIKNVHPNDHKSNNLYITKFNEHWHNRILYPKKVKKHIGPQQISTFILNGTESALKKIPIDNFILCVIYTAGDIQIGITGTVNKNETPERAVVCELEEEARLTIKKAPLIISTFESQYSKFDILESRLSDTKSIKQIQNRKDEKNEDGKKHKIGCIVHGSKDDMKRVVKSIKCPSLISKCLSLHSSHNEYNDNICGVAFMTVKTALNIIDSINELKNIQKDMPVNQKNKYIIFDF